MGFVLEVDDIFGAIALPAERLGVGALSDIDIALQSTLLLTKGGLGEFVHGIYLHTSTLRSDR